MELKKIVLGISCALGIASFAHAGDQGHGNFTFKGAIIDAPCSIESSTDQAVDMGQISNASLAKGGKSKPVNFAIKLTQCDLSQKGEKAGTVTVTFNGPKGAIDGSLGMGQVTGASIILNDGKNEKIKLGNATSAQVLADGQNTLNFSAYVQGNGAADEKTNAVELGEFNTTAGFTLAYQ